MKAIKFIASLFVSATVLSSAIAGNAPKKAAEGLAVDTKGSKIHWLAKKVTGQHEGFISISNGNLSVAKGKVTGGTFTIDMKSIVCTDITDAGYNQKFISHITTGDFFEVEKYPTAIFKITGIKKNNDKVYNSLVTGNLTVKGKTNTISFPAKITYANGTVSLASKKFSIDRQKFDVAYKSTMQDVLVKDDMDLQVKVTAK